MGKKNMRGKNPSRETITKLWLISGGRCQFEGCNENLFRDNMTWKDFNGSNIAHIVASSPNGPRGSAKSDALSDKIENLMLLCPKHHKEIDQFIEDFPVERLIHMKKLQEQKVQQLLEGMNYPDAEILILESPIKGSVDIRVDYSKAVDALRSVQYNPASTYPLLIRVDNSNSDKYSSPEYWDVMVRRLYDNLSKELNSRLRYTPSLRLAVFPMAPIPLIAKLGELIGDKRPVEIFQKSRTPDTWEWRNQKTSNSFNTEIINRQEGNPNSIALIISLTAAISLDRVAEVYDASTIFHLRATNNGVDCISSIEDLSLFWHEYQKICDEIKNNYQTDSVAVFPAVPVAAAFEIGRRHMPGIHPILHIYDDDHGFFETVKIGG